MLKFLLSFVVVAAAIGTFVGQGVRSKAVGASNETAVCSAPASQEVAASGFRGFCRCGCSPIPDCNTSADCGGAPCLHAITCC